MIAIEKVSNTNDQFSIHFTLFTGFPDGKTMLRQCRCLTKFNRSENPFQWWTEGGLLHFKFHTDEQSFSERLMSFIPGKVIGTYTNTASEMRSVEVFFFLVGNAVKGFFQTGNLIRLSYPECELDILAKQKQLNQETAAYVAAHADELIEKPYLAIGANDLLTSAVIKIVNKPEFDENHFLIYRRPLFNQKRVQLNGGQGIQVWDFYGQSEKAIKARLTEALDFLFTKEIHNCFMQNADATVFAASGSDVSAVYVYQHFLNKLAAEGAVSSMGNPGHSTQYVPIRNPAFNNLSLCIDISAAENSSGSLFVVRQTKFLGSQTTQHIQHGTFRETDAATAVTKITEILDNIFSNYQQDNSAE